MKSYLLFLIIFLIFSCQSKKHNSLSKDIQINIDDSTGNFYGPVLKVGDELGLKRLSSGADSFELRIWSGTTTSPDRLFRIQFEKEGWKTEFKEWIEDSWKSFVFSEKKKINEFIDSIFILKIRELGPQRETYVDHPVFFSIELASQNTYNFLTYNTPYLFEFFPEQQKVDSNDVAVSNLLYLIDRHFYRDTEFVNWYEKEFSVPK